MADSFQGASSKSQALDYHVGVLRGYMLALNAPTQVLHAVEILLSEHRSKAGPLIGQAEPLPAEKPKAQPVVPALVKPGPAPVEQPAGASDKKKYFWDSQDDAILEKMCAEGKGPAAIAKAVGRTAASVSTRISVRGLKRGSKSGAA